MRSIRLLPPRGTITSTCFSVGDQVADGGAVGGGDRPARRVCGRPAAASALVHAGGDRLVAADRLGAAAQDRRVAGLEAQPRGVGGHVRARFVDDADDAQRHAHHPDLDAGRPVPEVGDLADGIGQRRDRVEALRHRGDRLRRQRQPVDERGDRCRRPSRPRRPAAFAASSFALVAADRRGHRGERVVPRLRCRRARARAPRRARPRRRPACRRRRRQTCRGPGC